MASGRIELVHNFEGETGFVILRWYKTTAPLTAASGLVDGNTVTEVVYPAPHGQESLLIEELDPVMYFVKAFRSADGSTIDEQINVLACDAAIAARYILTMLTYIVGRGETGDPVEGDTVLRDSRLENQNYTIEERGTGTIVPPGEVGAEYVDRSDDGGGWDWIEGKQFWEGGVYFVFVQNRVDTDPGTSISGPYTDILTITEDTPYTFEDFNGWNVVVDSVNTTVTVDLEELATLADARFKLITHTGTQRNTIVQLASGNTAWFRGEEVNKIIMGRGEWLELLIKNSGLWIIAGQTFHEQIGALLWHRSTTPLLNTIIADGGLYDMEDYPRVEQYLDTISTVTLGAWTTDQGKWGRSSTQFRTPNLIDQFIRGVSSNPGRSQAEEVGPHVHQFRPGNGGGITTTPGGGALIVNNSNPYNADGYVLTNTGTENRPANIGLIPHICI